MPLKQTTISASSSSPNQNQNHTASTSLSKNYTFYNKFINFTSSKLPITNWLKNYNFKSDFLNDIISGLTVGIIHIPQGITYGNILGGQAPIFGLYTSLFPAIIYSIFGTSRHLSLGTFAITCLILGQGAEEMHPFPEETFENQTLIDEIYSKRQLDASNIAFLNFLILFIMSILNAGFVVKILSPAMLSGFITGAAVHVFTSQLKTIFGLEIERSSGVGQLLFTYKNLGGAVYNLSSASSSSSNTSDNTSTTSSSNSFSPASSKFMATTILAILMIILLFSIRTINEKYKKSKFKNIPIPGELIVLIMGTVLVYFLNLDENYHLKIVGHVSQGMPEFSWPSIVNGQEPKRDLKYLLKLLSIAGPIAAIGYASGISIALSFGKDFNYEEEISANQELLAFSFSNLFGSCLQCLPAYGSISRSCIQAESGGKSQLASIISSLLLLLVINFAGPLFYSTPRAALSAIVIVSVTSMLKKIYDFKTFIKVGDKIDASVWMITFSGTVILNVIFGLLIGLVVCLIVQIFRQIEKKLLTIEDIEDSEESFLIFESSGSTSECREKNVQISGSSESTSLDFETENSHSQAQIIKIPSNKSSTTLQPRIILEITEPLDYLHKDEINAIFKNTNSNNSNASTSNHGILVVIVKSRYSDYEGCLNVCKIILKMSENGRKVYLKSDSKVLGRKILKLGVLRRQ